MLYESLGFNEAGATMAPETVWINGKRARGIRASMRPGQQWPRKPDTDPARTLRTLALQ